jgi:ribosomal protein S24E
LCVPWRRLSNDKVVDVLHPSRANLSKDEVRTRLATLYKTPKENVQTFGFRTQFGGGKSTGFAVIYDSEADLKKFEASLAYLLVYLLLAPLQKGPYWSCVQDREAFTTAAETEKE